MADVRERAVEGDAVADVNVEAILPVGLVHPVRVCQREGFPLLAVTWVGSRKKKAREFQALFLRVKFGQKYT